MKKYIIAFVTFLLIAAVSNAQTQKQPSPAATKKPVAAHQHTSPVAKAATTTSAATPAAEEKKTITPATAIKRKHHVVKNKEAMKTKAQ